MEHLIYHVKFKMSPTLLKFHILFSTVKLKLNDITPILSIDSKFGLLNLDLSAREVLEIQFLSLNEGKSFVGVVLLPSPQTPHLFLEQTTLVP